MAHRADRSTKPLKAVSRLGHTWPVYRCPRATRPTPPPLTPEQVADKRAALIVALRAELAAWTFRRWEIRGAEDGTRDTQADPRLSDRQIRRMERRGDRLDTRLAALQATQ